MRWAARRYGTCTSAAADDADCWPRPGIRFLTVRAGRPTAVRKPILASWWRSRQCARAADHIELPYVRDPDLDTPLTRTAEPVLRAAARAAGRPADQHHPHRPDRPGADPAYRRRRSGPAPGPGRAGARLQLRRASSSAPTASAPRWRPAGPTHVFGHEHYAENLEDLACAGVPIHHPVSGKTVGVDRPDLLAQGRRPAADRAGQDHGRPDPPGAADRTATSASWSCSRRTCGPAGAPPASCWPSTTTS